MTGSALCDTLRTQGVTKRNQHTTVDFVTRALQGMFNQLRTHDKPESSCHVQPDVHFLSRINPALRETS